MIFAATALLLVSSTFAQGNYLDPLMTPKLSQQAKGVMSPIHGPVHWQATSRIPYRGTSKPDVFLNVGDEGVFHYEDPMLIHQTSQSLFGPSCSTVSLFHFGWNQGWLAFWGNCHVITDFGSPGKKLDLKMQLHPSSTLESKAAIVQECKDNALRCNEFVPKGYCSNPDYKQWMYEYCKKSCGHCDSTGSSGSCGRTYTPQSRIISGTDARPGAWPWMVSLVRKASSGLRHFCGASLITPKWVLTASHCVDQIKNYANHQVKLGEHNHNRDEGWEQIIDIRRIIMHPEYSLSPIYADVALIELMKPARLNSRVQTICLPSTGEVPRQGSSCYLSGWGSIQHPGSSYHLLQQARLPVVATSNCVHSDEVVCAGYGKTSKTNACRGDSGGPLVCRQRDGRWLQHGVASFVVTYCKYYTGFAPVNKYINWITKYVPL